MASWSDTFGHDDILDVFVSVNLKDSPDLVVGTNIWCNDIDQTNGRMECLDRAVVSHTTGQKYIVPRDGDYLIPVPNIKDWNLVKLDSNQLQKQNWTVYKVTEDQLQELVIALRQNTNSSLNDFYAIVETNGTEFRQYY